MSLPPENNKAKEIRISKGVLFDLKLKNQQYLVEQAYYDKPPGDQEYRLYSYLSTFFDHCLILDIGTLNGRSAVALSHNDNNTVISYNLIDQIQSPGHPIYTKPNLLFRVKDVLDDLTPAKVQKLKIVAIDIDHYGDTEQKIIDRLKELNFSGIILLDDIHHPQPELRAAMAKLWKAQPYPKYDVSMYGHWSGTGLILMNADVISIVLE
jgi:hypothetical protein